MCGAGEGTERVCTCIAGAQKSEERESMDVMALGMTCLHICVKVHRPA